MNQMSTEHGSDEDKEADQGQFPPACVVIVGEGAEVYVWKLTQHSAIMLRIEYHDCRSCKCAKQIGNLEMAKLPQKGLKQVQQLHQSTSSRKINPQSSLQLLDYSKIA